MKLTAAGQKTKEHHPARIERAPAFVAIVALFVLVGVVAGQFRNLSAILRPAPVLKHYWKSIVIAQYTSKL
jgi:hypothetical protein